MDGDISHVTGPKASFVARAQRNTEARTIAKQAIGLLEARIHDEFGVTIKMGAELEFAVSLRQKNPYFYHQTNPAFTLKEKEESLKAGADPSLIRDEPEKCPQFPDSTRVAYGYIDENGVSEDWDTVEFIISHEPCDSQGLPHTRPMAALAREIDALIHQVCKPARGYKNPPDAFDHQAQSRNWQRFHHNKVREIRALSYLPEDNMAFGLHLNYSLWDSHGKSWNLRSDHREFANQMNESTCRLFAENLPLIAQSENARTRLHRQFHSAGIPAFEHHAVGHNSSGYYENKICGIDTDPYYAVMLQLAAIYEGLQQFRVSKPHQQPEEEPMAQKEAYVSKRLALAVKQPEAYLKEDFINPKRNHLIGTLDQVQPGLGARFMGAFARENAAIPSGHRR